jgi:hypothetical protein
MMAGANDFSIAAAAQYVMPGYAVAHGYQANLV